MRALRGLIGCRARHRVTAFLGLFALAASAASCGGGFTATDVFSHEWTDDRGASIERVRARLAGRIADPQADVVVGVVDEQHHVGLSLTDQRPAWTYVHAIETRPLIAGNVVLASGAGEMFALDAARGTLLWKRPTGNLPLYSAGDDGKVTVAILGRAGGRGSTVLAVARDGNPVRQVETSEVLGSPAVLGGLAFIPWGSEYVSVLDLSGGEELGRVTFRQEVRHSWVFGGSLFFGDLGMFRFDAQIARASRGGATHLTLPKEPLPGDKMALFPPSDRDIPVVANAYDSARLFARGTGGEGLIALAGDRVYASYFRVLEGFDSKGQLAWVRHIEANLLGGAAGRSSIAACDARGRISVFDAKTGALHDERELGQPVRACVVQLDRYEPAGKAEPAMSRIEQLEVVMNDRDAQLVPAQRALLEALAADPSDEATALLLDLAGDPRTAPELAAAAEAKIAGRRNGTDALLRELDRHYDYITDVLRAPPVAVIAPALAAIKEPRGAAALAKHLFDPGDTDEDIHAAAKALEVLATPAELPEIARFFAAYRATTETEALVEAAACAATTLLDRGTDAQKKMVKDAIDDATTSDGLRAKLRAMTAPPPVAAAAPAAKPAASSAPRDWH
jgi:outer membrane protein assembly factor BamB